MGFDRFHQLTLELINYLRFNSAQEEFELLYPIWVGMLPKMKTVIHRASPDNRAKIIVALGDFLLYTLHDYANYPKARQAQLSTLLNNYCDLLRLTLKSVTLNTPLLHSEQINLCVALREAALNADTRQMTERVLQTVTRAPLNEVMDIQHALQSTKDLIGYLQSEDGQDKFKSLYPMWFGQLPKMKAAIQLASPEKLAPFILPLSNFLLYTFRDYDNYPKAYQNKLSHLLVSCCDLLNLSLHALPFKTPLLPKDKINLCMTLRESAFNPATRQVTDQLLQSVTKATLNEGFDIQNTMSLTEVLTGALKSEYALEQFKTLYPIWVDMLPNVKTGIQQASPEKLKHIIISVEEFIILTLYDYLKFPASQHINLSKVLTHCCDVLNTALQSVTPKTPLSVNDKINLCLGLRMATFNADTRQMTETVLNTLMRIPMNKDFDFQHALQLILHAHHLGVDGHLYFSQQAEGLGVGKMELLGLKARFFFSIVQTSLNEFFSDLQPAVSHLNELSRFIQLKLKQCEQLSEYYEDNDLIQSAWKNYQSGSPLLIHTGYRKHDLYMVFTPTHCYFANRGDRFHEPGFAAFKMTHPLTFDIFSRLVKLEHGKDIPFANGRDYLHKILPKTLGLVFDEARSLITSGQKYGNCSLSSLKIAIKGLMYLYFNDKTRAHKLYKQWSSFDRDRAADQFFQALKRHQPCLSIHEQFIQHWLYAQHDLKKVDEITRAVKAFGHLPLSTQAHVYESKSSQVVHPHTSNDLKTFIDACLPSFFPLWQLYKDKQAQDVKIRALKAAQTSSEREGPKQSAQKTFSSS